MPAGTVDARSPLNVHALPHTNLSSESDKRCAKPDVMLMTIFLVMVPSSDSKICSASEGVDDEEEREDDLVVELDGGARDAEEVAATEGKAPLCVSSSKKLPFLIAEMTSSSLRSGPDIGALA